jgi:hypothetical protein
MNKNASLAAFAAHLAQEKKVQVDADRNRLRGELRDRTSIFSEP